MKRRGIIILLCAILTIPGTFAQQKNVPGNISLSPSVKEKNFRSYAGLSFMIPSLGAGKNTTCWGLDLTGYGMERYFTDALFVDVSGHLMYGMSKYKVSKDWFYVTHCFSLHVPVMFGVAISELSVRAGGFLQYSVGWMKERDGKEVYRETFGEMGADRLGYGVRFGVSWSVFDVGFLMTWTPNASESTKGLTFGLRF